MRTPAMQPRPLDELHVRIFVSQNVEIHTNWKQKDVYSSYWRLYINNRDGASAILPTGAYKLPGGKIHIIPAWVLFSCHNTEKIDHCFIHFDVVGLPAALVREVFSTPATLRSEKRLDTLAEQWLDDMKSKRPLDLAVLCRVKALAFTALAELMNGLAPEQHARCLKHLFGQHAVTPAIEYVNDHLHEPLENAQLAALCHLSEDHFIRLFRQFVGQTPAQYILDRRMSTAAQQLIFSNEKVDAIAEQCGFRDRFYFSRVFARRMGMPPATYRRTDRV